MMAITPWSALDVPVSSRRSIATLRISEQLVSRALPGSLYVDEAGGDGHVLGLDDEAVAASTAPSIVSCRGRGIR